MSNPANKDLVRQLLDAHSRQDTAQVRQILSPQFAWHMGGAEKPLGRDHYLKGMEQGAKAFSDMTLTIDQLVAEDDRVVVLLRHQLRHTGQFMNLAPTGRQVTFVGFWMYRIADGHIVEAWQVEEDLAAKLRAAS